MNVNKCPFAIIVRMPIDANAQTRVSVLYGVVVKCMTKTTLALLCGLKSVLRVSNYCA